MNHRHLIGPVLAILFLLGISRVAGALEMQDVIEIVPGGSVNWTHGSIQAQGIKTPEDPPQGKLPDRRDTLVAAIDDARQNLLRVVNGIRVDSSHRVDQVLAKNDTIVTQVEKMVRAAPVVKQAYLSDGSAAVTVEMQMEDGFSQLLLPQEIKQIEPIKTVSTTEKTPESENGEGATPVAPPEATGFTGLVVDARGLELFPTMSPRIYDESGLEVYGSAFVSREFAVQKGMIQYGINLEAAAGQPRVADNPLVVKGLRTTQPGHTDIIISNADASKIRASSAHLSFLKKCRVLVVVSSREES